MAKFSYLVTVNVREIDYPATLDLAPHRLGSRRIEGYIRDAVGSWGGQLDPEDLLFPSNIRKVTVVPVGEK